MSATKPKKELSAADVEKIRRLVKKGEGWGRIAETYRLSIPDIGAIVNDRLHEVCPENFPPPDHKRSGGVHNPNPKGS